MKRAILAGLTGIIFGLGLAVSGMMNPAKVIGFLDFSGNWDPSLMFVLAGATGITALLYPRVLRSEKPMFDNLYHIPEKAGIKPMLLIGSAIFGIGWGLVGLCPGPVFTLLTLGYWEVWVFFGAMIAGMGLYKYGHQVLVSLRPLKDETA